MPGVYLDGAAVHIDTRQLCRNMRVPFTAPNVLRVRESVVETLTEMGDVIAQTIEIVEH
jgi:hypothetical protein